MRIVLTRIDRDRINRVLRDLKHVGIGMAYVCRPVEGFPESCGQLMRNEGEPPNDGYGCDCKRIHFI